VRLYYLTRSHSLQRGGHRIIKWCQQPANQPMPHESHQTQSRGLRTSWNFNNSLLGASCTQDANCPARYKCYAAPPGVATRVCGCNRAMLASGDNCQSVHPLAIFTIGWIVLVMVRSLIYGASIWWFRQKEPKKAPHNHRRSLPPITSIAFGLLFASNCLVFFNCVVSFARLWPVPFERLWYLHGQHWVMNLAVTAGNTAMMLVALNCLQVHARDLFTLNGRLPSWRWGILGVYLIAAAVEYAGQLVLVGSHTNQFRAIHQVLDTVIWLLLTFALSFGAGWVRRAMERAEALGLDRAREAGAPGPSRTQAAARLQAVTQLNQLAHQLRQQLLCYTLVLVGYVVADSLPLRAPLANVCFMGIYTALQNFFMIMYCFLMPPQSPRGQAVARQLHKNPFQIRIRPSQVHKPFPRQNNISRAKLFPALEPPRFSPWWADGTSGESKGSGAEHDKHAQGHWPTHRLPVPGKVLVGEEVSHPSFPDSTWCNPALSESVVTFGGRHETGEQKSSQQQWSFLNQDTHVTRRRGSMQDARLAACSLQPKSSSCLSDTDKRVFFTEITASSELPSLAKTNIDKT